jgi:hypothetical protein
VTMRHANRLLVIQEAALLHLRIQDGAPSLEVTSPAHFSAVSLDANPTVLRAVIVALPPKHKQAPEDPAYRVLGRHEIITCNSKFVPIKREANPTAPNISAVVATMTPPSVMGRLLPSRASTDLCAAEEAIAFEHLLMLKESKSATRQAFISGDATTTAMGQTADSEREVFIGEAVNVSVLDRAMDLTLFAKVAEGIADTAGANYGVSPAIRKQADATSGAEAWLRRAPLLERRREQIDTFRRIERQLVAHMAATVDAAGLDAYRFAPSGWAIDFGELSAPLTEAEELANFRERRALSIDDTLSYVMKRNPDLDEDQATEAVATHVKREVARVALLQELSAMNANSSTAIGDETNGNRDAAPVTGDENRTIQ